MMPDLTNNDRNRNLSFGVVCSSLVNFGSLPIDLEDHSLEEVCDVPGVTI